MKKVITPDGGKPIKMWLDDLDEFGIEQAENAAKLPFTHKHVAVMSDGHMGYSLPVGGVIACDGVVIPSAVGYDGGCGVKFVQTEIPASILMELEDKKGDLVLESIPEKIKRIIPVGHRKHKVPQEWDGWHTAPEVLGLQEALGVAPISLGTLGKGNHFLELQKDERGRLCFMIHSGSRNLGKQICTHYNGIAKKLNEKWHSSVPKEWGLAFFPIDSREGKEYIEVMEFACRYAWANRYLMMKRLVSLVFNLINKYHVKVSKLNIMDLDVLHNYARMENHFYKNVMVHRKGAISAKEGQYGIIPGSMGTSSYIVRGLGNKDSFMSCSHGAGRKMSRTKAKENLDVDQQVKIMNDQGIIHGMRSSGDLDEAPGAYKDIDVVMENQKDLVEIVHKLTPIAVIKG